MKRALLLLLTLLTIASATSGCAKMMGDLRRDLDDQEYDTGPTVGGAWPEAGMLDDDRDPVGHSERGPASDSYGGARGRASWLDQDDADANARDRYRKMDGDESEEGEQVALDSENTPNHMPPVKRRYKNGARATRSDFIDESPNEGSLWASDGQTNYYFTKNKIRGVGDIVTVNIEEPMVKDIASEVRRTLSAREKEAELGLAQERLAKKAQGIPDPADGKAGKDAVASSQAAPARAPAGQEKDTGKKKEDVEIPQATYADIDVAKSLDVKAGDTMMAEIIERYPNGNYKIRGVKRVPYRGQTRLMDLVGIMKSSDIGEDDTIPSGKLYEYRLEALR